MREGSPETGDGMLKKKAVPVSANINEMVSERTKQGKFGATPIGSWHYIYGDRIYSAMHMYKYEKVRQEGGKSTATPHKVP